MKTKHLLFLLLLVLLCFSLHVTAYAHPGNTNDDDGGHTDSSTGEYHYHHGEGAHSHYDMDGDGDIDCPYNFVDKTGQNSGSTNTSSNQFADNSDNADDVDLADNPPLCFSTSFWFCLIFSHNTVENSWLLICSVVFFGFFAPCA